jgi:PLAT/LH2 domain
MPCHLLTLPSQPLEPHAGVFVMECCCGAASCSECPHAQLRLLVQDDRLCWFKEEDLSTPTSDLGPGQAAAVPVPQVTLLPSAAQGIGMDTDAAAASATLRKPSRASAAPSSAAGLTGNSFAAAGGSGAGPSGSSAGVPLGTIMQYIPLDRVPIRSTPRGYVPGTAISKITDSQVVARDSIGTAFAVTAGSHTHFFAAESEADATEWVGAIKQAWFHCAMHTQRSSQSDWSVVESARRSECMTAATATRLQMEKLQLLRSLQTAESDQAAEISRLRSELQQVQCTKHASTVYEVCVITSSHAGANTNSRVYLEIFGRQPGRRSFDAQLTYPIGSKKRPFKRGAEDAVEVTSEDLGEIAAVHLWSDASGSKPDWHAASVHVRRKPADGEVGEPWTDFWANRWLSTTKGDRKLAVKLQANQAPVEVQRCAHTTLSQLPV